MSLNDVICYYDFMNATTQRTRTFGSQGSGGKLYIPGCTGDAFKIQRQILATLLISDSLLEKKAGLSSNFQSFALRCVYIDPISIIGVDARI